MLGQCSATELAICTLPSNPLSVGFEVAWIMPTFSVAEVILSLFCFVLFCDKCLIVQAGLELMWQPRMTEFLILLPAPPECWAYRRCPSCLALDISNSLSLFSHSLCQARDLTSELPGCSYVPSGIWVIAHLMGIFLKHDTLGWSLFSCLSCSCIYKKQILCFLSV